MQRVEIETKSVEFMPNRMVQNFYEFCLQHLGKFTSFCCWIPRCIETNNKIAVSIVLLSGKYQSSKGFSDAYNEGQ